MLVNDNKLGNCLGSSNFLVFLVVATFADTCPSTVNEAFKQYLITFTSSLLRLLDTNSTRSMIRSELLALEEADIEDSVRLAVINEENRSLEMGEAADL